MSAASSAPATPAAPLLTTPLNALHIELGARMVPFAGYSMPVQYPAGLMAEHVHTRTAAGLFDVSHMGQLKLIGADAAAAFETLMPVDVIDLPEQQLAPDRVRTNTDSTQQANPTLALNTLLNSNSSTIQS